MSESLIAGSLIATINRMRMMGTADEQIAFALRLPLHRIEAIPYPRPNPERSRAVQDMQLRMMAETYAPLAEKGDRSAALLLLKIQDRQAALLGLDAPKEVIQQNYNRNFNLNYDDLSDEDLDRMTTTELKRLYLKVMDESKVVDGEVLPETPPEPEPD